MPGIYAVLFFAASVLIWIVSDSIPKRAEKVINVGLLIGALGLAYFFALTVGLGVAGLVGLMIGTVLTAFGIFLTMINVTGLVASVGLAVGALVISLLFGGMDAYCFHHVC